MNHYIHYHIKHRKVSPTVEKKVAEEEMYELLMASVGDNEKLNRVTFAWEVGVLRGIAEIEYVDTWR